MKNCTTSRDFDKIASESGVNDLSDFALISAFVTEFKKNLTSSRFPLNAHAWRRV